MNSTYTTLQTCWNKSHLEHLIFCLEYHKDIYQDKFEFGGIGSKGEILIDDEAISVQMILKMLTLYYEDSNSKYQTPFGDFLYLVFTDLVNSNIDILNQIAHR